MLFLIGKPFTERDRKLLQLLLRPDGASLDQINRAVAKKAAAYSYSGDTQETGSRDKWPLETRRVRSTWSDESR
jgi:hypothetical protein